MARNSLKQMTRNRDAKLGHFIVEFVTPGIGHILKAAGCELDRKVLAQLAASADPKAFAGLVDLAKQALAQAPQASPAPAKA